MKNYCFLFSALLTLTQIQAQDFYGPGIQEVRLELSQKNWDVILDSLKKANPEARLAGTVWVNNTRFDSAGIRFKGNSSYFRTRKDTYKKLPFNIRLDYKIKTQKIAGQNNSVRLSNAFLDPSFIRDPLAYDLIRKYMPAPQCNFAKLKVNGKFYGLYVNTEAIDAAFIKKHYGSTNGYLVKCDPDSWQKVKSQPSCPAGENASLAYLNDNPGCYDRFYEVDKPEAWQPMMQLIKTLNKTPDKIENVLNVDQTLWMLALNNAIVNLDSYNGALSHNYYIWFDSTGVGHPMIWDLNMAFGGWRRNLAFKDMTDVELAEYNPLAEIDNPKRPLISKLLRNPLYKKIYLAHLRTVTTEQLKSGYWNTRAQSMIREIDPWVKLDSLKLYSYTNFQQALDKTMQSGPDNVIGLRQLMEKRSTWLAAHPLLNKTQPVVSEAKHAKEGDKIKISARMSGAKNAWLFYRTSKSLAFKRMAMRDDGTEGDTAAGDGIYTARLDAAFVKHYYLGAESDEAAALLPERAAFEFFKVE
jgi:CotH kinase protein